MAHVSLLITAARNEKWGCLEKMGIIGSRCSLLLVGNFSNSRLIRGRVLFFLYDHNFGIAELTKLNFLSGMLSWMSHVGSKLLILNRVYHRFK